jgi:type IV secretion system protein VirB1
MLQRKLTVAVAIAALPLAAGAQMAPFEQLATRCAPDIDPITLAALVRTESSFNQFAIGVVGRPLARQPRTLTEALATADALQQQGANFSLGWAQVNRFNLLQLGETYAGMFEPCRNLKAAGAILQACYQRARGAFATEQQALRAAFSCYYSGNFKRGFQTDAKGQPSYVQKVVANALGTAPRGLNVPAVAWQGAEEDAQPVRAARIPAARAAAPASQPTVASVPWVVMVDADSKPPAALLSTDRAPVIPARHLPSAGSPDTLPDAHRAMRSRKQLSRQPQPFVQFVD